MFGTRSRVSLRVAGWGIARASQAISRVVLLLGLCAGVARVSEGQGQAAQEGGAGARAFVGPQFAGEGDVAYLETLDIARRMFSPDPELQNVAMLYQPQWNGLVEGPTWGAWWVQNSYGTTFGALPFYEEPFVTFLQNSQDLWFDRMGDGRTSYVWNGKDSWVPPDGCLMDAASDIWAIHRQGDGRVGIHDWGMEFTAAGSLLQAELLLIGRDGEAIRRYLPKLERAARFIETRRDPTHDLFWVGPAGNLLAPSYAGYRRPDGSYGMAYLAGLSVSYCAFLDRLVELETLAGRPAEARVWKERRATAREGLKRLTTDEGYLVKSLDPDGTRHGVYGAAKHGYFEASPNHDAICFRVVDDAQARKIYERMASIPALRPHDLIIANAPSLDDMYEEPKGLWGFGTWVNGGHWTTCEARMMMAYLRVGAFADAERSMAQILRFARRFRLDNPLVDFGGAVYQPNEPINLTYDAFGAPAGLLRGLFEYLYRADGLTLIPHLPTGIDRLEQKFPVRFGTKRLYLAVAGHGPIQAVRVNGRRWRDFDGTSVHLAYDQLPEVAAIEIVAGAAKRRGWKPPKADRLLPEIPEATSWPTSWRNIVVQAPSATVDAKPRDVDLAQLTVEVRRARRFAEALRAAGLGDRPEAAHAALVVRSWAAGWTRANALEAGRWARLPEASQVAADRLYWSTTAKLAEGLARVMAKESSLAVASPDPDRRRRKLLACWAAAEGR